MKRHLLLYVFALALLCAGCPKPDADKGKGSPPPGTTLQVLVVDDLLLAQSIGYLESEWEAQSGVALEIADISASDFNPRETPAADVVVARPVARRNRGPRVPAAGCPAGPSS